MDAASMLLVLLAAGVNFGWQPTHDAADGYEYVVQIEPELLDVLRSGQKMPIESNIPPEIAPIRKVSIVVGRGDLPRTAREPVNHTSYFAGQSGWTPDRYTQAPPQPAAMGERYAQPPANNANAVQPPPSLTDRARSTLSETGNSLREGLEAGMQAANEQLRALSSTTTPPLVTNRRNRGGVAPPPWAEIARLTEPDWSTNESDTPQPPVDPTASSRMAPMQTSSGWTSIGSNVAAPPLMVPQLTTAPAPGTSSPPTHENGFSFPPPASAPPASAPPASAPPVSVSDSSRSLLSQASRNRQPPTPRADDWVLGVSEASEETSSSPAAFGQSDQVTPLTSTLPENNLLPLHGPQLAVQSSQPQSQSQQQEATNPWARRWEDDERWNQPPQSLPETTPTVAPRAESQFATGGAAGDSTTITTGSPAADTPPIPRQSLAQNTAAQAPATPVTESAPSAAASTAAHTVSKTPPSQNASPVTAPAEQWLPLLIVSLLLLGSVGANLFLGWSYLDARQRYRNLARKTADKFRRAATSAA